MPEYVQKAKEYAGMDSDLLKRILQALNSTEFQKNQIKYLKEWDKNLILSQGGSEAQEVFYISKKVDKAFDFFKENFYWKTVD